MRALPVIASLLLFVVVVACGDGDDTSSATAASNETASSTPESSETGQPPEATGLPSVSLERVFPELTFEGMTGMYPAPDGSWYVTEQAGRITQVTPSASRSAIKVVLDITDRVSTDGNEEGLLGLALAPDSASTGTYYVYYSAGHPRRGVLSRFFLVPPDADAAGSEAVLMEVPEPFSNHNGGQIVFGSDGYLYIGLGDGGSARDPQGNGQNLGTLLGSILRIDVSDGSAGYVVPPDNPFAGRSSARGEIWAYGLRNPWRFSFDPTTGDLWAGDVGQSTREEIDLIVRGGNYGWNVMEGFGCVGGGSNCDKDGFLLPVADYENGGGNCSVTGGFIYRGSAIPGLQGAYVYSDYCSGKIWALRLDGSKVTQQKQIGRADFNVSSFAQGNDLELYVLDHSESGGIYKIVP